MAVKDGCCCCSASSARKLNPEPEAEEEAMEDDAAGDEPELSIVESGRGAVKGSNPCLEKEMLLWFPSQTTDDGVPVLVPAPSPADDEVPLVPAAAESASQAQIPSQDAESIISRFRVPFC